MTDGGARVLAAWFGCLVSAVAFAADEPPPDAGFLEFLGSWSGEEASEDWFDFLASLAGEDRETAVNDDPDDTVTHHEAP
jgi:hypothetical protein